VWGLQVRLQRRAGRAREEVEASLQWADRLEGARESAAALSNAAELCRGPLGDEARAEALFLAALHKDGSWLPALIGAGELAFARGQWADAERRFETGCALLRDSEPEPVNAGAFAQPLEPEERKRALARLARLAAQAAHAENRTADALRHLETALLADPQDGAALEAMAALCLELGAYERARSCVQSRLDAGPADEQRVPLWNQLARACEEIGDLPAAVATLEQLLQQQPADEAARARAVGLLERLGETDRALAHMEQWTALAAAQFRPSLRVRSAQIEAAAGRSDAARARLEQLVQENDAADEAWHELASLVRARSGAGAALDVTERALAAPRAARVQTELLWMQADVLRELGRLPEAALRAREVLALDPERLDAGLLLARNLGHAGDWADAAHKLQSLLESSAPPPVLAAEIWEAVGRAYAGPLEDVEHAANAYRAALAANPLRQSASEALADVTVFDPRTHRESLQLHRALLESFPARKCSWRALRRIADHWQRERARDSCDTVLETLDGAEPQSRGLPLLAYTGRAHNAAVHAASEYLRACEQAECLPANSEESSWSQLADPVREELTRVAGRAWTLPDAAVTRLWREAASGERDLASDAPRRMRRRLREAQTSETRALLQHIGTEEWRQQVLAEACSRALAVGRLGLRESVLALLGLWPQTAAFDARAAGDLPALIQACPPAGTLLRRIADAVLTALPV
jgi:tetratricopeptide (TPR) repeat protein